jgi:alpha-beta hydrolase superfamily lysophospholipase
MLKKITKIFILSLLLVLSFIAGYIYKSSNLVPVSQIAPPEPLKPLIKYEIENLSKTRYPTGNFLINKLVSQETDYDIYYFDFQFSPDPQDTSILKSTSGQINIPRTDNTKSLNDFPVILMFRGYVDQNLYETGEGSSSAAAYFSKNGYITVAPDFLGYADSDSEADNIFESRFQTYVTAVSLLYNLEKTTKFTFNNKVVALTNKNIFIWGHSNGGQIALATLEITKSDHPTVLWAPVTKPFPYSILYYTDDSDDRGKFIRRELAEFEKLYDVEKYSPDNYFDYINAPLQVHQGFSDEAVPKKWTDEFVNKLEDLSLIVDYNVYPGTDHNLRPNWDTAIARSIAFYNSYFNK